MTLSNEIRPIYHYTVEKKLADIFQDSQIRTANFGMCPGEKPAVWCTQHPEWENTCNKALPNGYLMDAELTHAIGGAVRILIKPEVATVNWEEWVRTSGVSPKMAKHLKNIALRQGSKIRMWRMSFNPIQAESWLGVERLQDGVWATALDDTGSVIPWIRPASSEKIAWDRLRQLMFYEDSDIEQVLISNSWIEYNTRGSV